jgi:3-hydroxyacyl-[acyl-carrier-protein] dehydratase
MKRVVESCLLELTGNAEAFEATFRFPADLEVFRGHFPGHPLVPGVFLIESVRVVAERILGEPLRITRVRDAKFTSIVEPDTTIAIRGSIADQRCRAALPGGSRVEIEFSGADC